MEKAQNLGGQWTEIPVKGWVSLNAYVDGARVEICGLVTDHVSDIFLGQDWLLLNQVEWKFSRGEIILDGRQHRLVAKKSRTTWCRCRRVVAEVEHPTSDSVINEMVSKVDKSISEEIKERLPELLKKYESTISLHELDLGWTDLVTHTIDTGDAKPIRQQLRRHPPAHQVDIDRQVSDLLAQGVIEPAARPWSSNVVLARKADGSWRCCIDFRQLNDVTRKDAYPLPRTDKCFDALAGNCLFSSLDLRPGYFQCALSPSDMDKTAFVTRRGMFRFRVLPFGVCNAPSCFQRLVDLTLSGLNFEICLVYIDDVILMSSTAEQHPERLELVLERFKRVNLKLKPSKCHLMQTKILFLGHRIS